MALLTVLIISAIIITVSCIVFLNCISILQSFIKMAAFRVLIISAIIAMVSCTPDGPPRAACVSLTPGHSPSSATDDPPQYAVTTNSATYEPGQAITGRWIGVILANFVVRETASHVRISKMPSSKIF